MTADDERRNALLAKKPDERTPAEVEELRTKYAVFGGCCSKFADQCGCDCLERARGGAARPWVFVVQAGRGGYEVRRGRVAASDATNRQLQVRTEADPGRPLWYSEREVFATLLDAQRHADQITTLVRARTGLEPPPPAAEPSASALGHSGEKYVRRIRSCRDRRPIGEVDVYSVLDAFGPLPAPRAHAIKKLLCAGLRDKGDAARDVREAIDALKEDLKRLEAGE